MSSTSGGVNEFYSALTDQIIFLLLAVTLFSLSFISLLRYRGRSADPHENGIMPMVVAAAAVGLSVGALILAPFTVFSQCALILKPANQSAGQANAAADSYWRLLRWLHYDLIQNLWSAAFWTSQVLLYIVLPFAFLFCEAPGSGAKTVRRAWWRALGEATIEQLLLLVIVTGILFTVSSLLGIGARSAAQLFQLAQLGTALAGQLLVLRSLPRGFGLFISKATTGTRWLLLKLYNSFVWTWWKFRRKDGRTNKQAPRRRGPRALLRRLAAGHGGNERGATATAIDDVISDLERDRAVLVSRLDTFRSVRPAVRREPAQLLTRAQLTDRLRELDNQLTRLKGTATGSQRRLSAQDKGKERTGPSQPGGLVGRCVRRLLCWPAALNSWLAGLLSAVWTVVNVGAAIYVIEESASTMVHNLYLLLAPSPPASDGAQMTTPPPTGLAAHEHCTSLSAATGESLLIFYLIMAILVGLYGSGRVRGWTTALQVGQTPPHVLLLHAGLLLLVSSAVPATAATLGLADLSLLGEFGTQLLFFQWRPWILTYNALFLYSFALVLPVPWASALRRLVSGPVGRLWQVVRSQLRLWRSSRSSSNRLKKNR